MKVEQAVNLFKEYRRMNSKETINSYKITIPRLNDDLASRELDSASSEEILAFLTSHH